MTEEEYDHGRSQAIAQLEAIRSMVAALDAGSESDQETALQTIQEDPLSIEVRSGWTPINELRESLVPAEYNIVLCTGGPAVRIIGELHEEGGVPCSAVLEYQDWGTLWTNLWVGPEDAEALLRYANCFCFEY